MDHDESIKSALARELFEEVGLKGDFSYKVIAVEEPGFLTHANVWQLRLIFEVMPEIFPTEAGSDADEIHHINSTDLKDSEHSAERSVFEYATISR